MVADRYKFRVYNHDYHEMLDILGFVINKDGSIYVTALDSKEIPWHRTLKHYELLQCTGYKDKFGSLVYENDILLSPDVEDPYAIKVFWDNDRWEIGAWNGEYFEVGLSNDEISDLQYFEVIDNGLTTCKYVERG